jgi:hypothetical protein
MFAIHIGVILFKYCRLLLQGAQVLNPNSLVNDANTSPNPFLGLMGFLLFVSKITLSYNSFDLHGI